MITDFGVKRSKVKVTSRKRIPDVGLCTLVSAGFLEFTLSWPAASCSIRDCTRLSVEVYLNQYINIYSNAIKYSHYALDHFLDQSLPNPKISWQSTHNFLSYTAIRQTDKHGSKHYPCQVVAEVKHTSLNLSTCSSCRWKYSHMFVISYTHTILHSALKRHDQLAVCRWRNRRRHVL